MNTKRKVVNGSLLGTKIIDPNLGIWTREKQRAGFMIMFLSPSHIQAAGWECLVCTHRYSQEFALLLIVQAIGGGLAAVTV